MPTVRLSMSEPADDLLSRDPLALLIGMLLDQQVPMEKAFLGPHVLRERLGRELDARELAELPAERVAELFSERPAIHRFPGSMAGRVQALCKHLLEHYDGRAEAIWADVATGAELLARLSALPGFGAQKAKIFLALLGKQYDVRPEGWRAAAGTYGEADAHRSVADVVDADSLAQVREYKKQAKQAAKQA
ncbi:MAG: Fe-S cluster assembly protein HesB [Geodermatophilaceae bacterium]|nr:Fe-S cluster assembly protein HesB [Geodermatophilaceae bacterium]